MPANNYLSEVLAKPLRESLQIIVRTREGPRTNQRSPRNAGENGKYFAKLHPNQIPSIKIHPSILCHRHLPNPNQLHDYYPFTHTLTEGQFRVSNQPNVLVLVLRVLLCKVCSVFLINCLFWANNANEFTLFQYSGGAMRKMSSFRDVFASSVSNS